MALVPALDLRPSPDPRDELDRLPSNLEAEQALLGILLYDADGAFERMTGTLTPAHFYEPFHGRLFRSISGQHRRGRKVDPVLMSEEFRRDPAFLELGGIRFLADLIDKAPMTTAPGQYEALILDLATRRDMIKIAQEMIGAAKSDWRADNGDATSAADLLAEYQTRMTSAAVTHVVDELVDIGDAVLGNIAYVQDRSKPVGIKSGITRLDKALGPILPEDLLLIAGRPGMGKSAISLGLSQNVAMPALADEKAGVPYDGRPPRGVIEFHLEMTYGDRDAGGQSARRHMADVGFQVYGAAFPTYQQIRDKDVTPEQVDMMARVARLFEDAPIKGIKRSGAKLSTIAILARRQFAAWRRVGIEPGLIIIDHLGLVAPDEKTSGQYERGTVTAKGAKDLAGFLGVGVVALVQLSRAVENRDDKRPILPDLRDSGALEESADAVAFLYREAYYAAREQEPDGEKKPDEWANWDRRRRSEELEVIIGKRREGEGSQVAKLWVGMGWNAARDHRPDDKGVFI